MSILNMIGGENGPAVQQLATQFGLSLEQANKALQHLLPLVASGVARETATKGDAGVLAALATGAHDTYITQPETLAEPGTITDGNAILGHIFANKAGSKTVAAEAAQKSGIDPAILQKMLPIVAALVMGALSRKTRGSATQPGGPKLSGGLGSILGSLIDRDHDGSVLNDLGGMIGGAGGRKS